MVGLRAATLALVAILVAQSMRDFVRRDNWTRDSAQVSQRFHPKIQKAVETKLGKDGIKVSSAIHAMLSVLLTAWETRPDLRSAFSTADGGVDVVGLLTWGTTLPDSFSTAIVPHLGAIEELRGRMSLLPADGNLIPVLYWTLQNRNRPFSDLRPVIGRIADVWRERPELLEQFSSEGRVDVPSLLQWINTLAPSDPAFGDFFWQYFEIRRAILELKRATS